MKYFDNWNDMHGIDAGFLERRIFTGEKAMLVHNIVPAHGTIPAHKHPHEQISYVLSGECDVTVCGETRHVTDGGVAWFPSNEEHLVVNTADRPLLVLDVFSPIREDFLK